MGGGKTKEKVGDQMLTLHRKYEMSQKTWNFRRWVTGISWDLLGLHTWAWGEKQGCFSEMGKAFCIQSMN